MFDMMHRMTDDWITMSAHVYDYNYHALCIIFIYKLKFEDATSQVVAWDKMLKVAAHHKIIDINITGFMANNAQAGWNAVQNAFYNGNPKPK